MWKLLIRSFTPIAIALFLLPAQAERLNLCTITINSSEEKDAFISHLRKNNPGQFNHVELTTRYKNGRNGHWFKNACADRNLQCDLLVVSGHFAGDFFSDQNDLTLSTEMLEQASCQNTCNNILKAPTETFLFGCNTMATQITEGRKRDEYVNELIKHGFYPDIAQRIAESLYNNWGFTYAERMKGIFKGNPRIYGFSSIAPSGKTITNPRGRNNSRPGMLQEYLNNVGDYASHLRSKRYKYEQLLHLKEKFGADQLTRKELNSLHNRALFTALDSEREKPNTTIAEDSGITEHDTVDYNAYNDRCYLYNPRVSLQNKLMHAHRLYEREDFTRYIPDLERFFYKNKPNTYTREERQLYAALAEKQEARDKVLNIISDTESAYIKAEMTLFSRNMNWLTQDEDREYTKKAIHSLLEDKFLNKFGYEFICKSAKRFPNLAEGLNSANVAKVADSALHIKSLYCIKAWDATIAEKMKELAMREKPQHLQDKKDVVSSLALKFLRANGEASPQHEPGLYSRTASSTTNGLREAATSTRQCVQLATSKNMSQRNIAKLHSTLTNLEQHMKLGEALAEVAKEDDVNDVMTELAGRYIVESDQEDVVINAIKVLRGSRYTTQRQRDTIAKLVYTGETRKIRSTALTVFKGAQSPRYLRYFAKLLKSDLSARERTDIILALDYPANRNADLAEVIFRLSIDRYENEHLQEAARNAKYLNR